MVLVLTTGSWPISASSQVEFQVPRDLEGHLDSFQKFYQTQHSGRKLTWLHHLAKCKHTNVPFFICVTSACLGDVKLNGYDKRYELQVSLCQYSLMSLFNERDSLSINEILGPLRLSLAEFKRNVKGLLDLNLFSVSRPAAGGAGQDTKLELEQCSESDVICISRTFSFKRIKIKVPQISQSETPKERESTHKAVDDDRKLYLQVTFMSTTWNSS